MDWIRSDDRRNESVLWAKWLDRVPRIRRAFETAIEDDPLLYNETASVGVLASAANKEGFLSLAEYVAIKRGKGRGRPHRNGRCDLWLYHPKPDRSWAFEFKQKFCSANPRRETILAALDQACDDAEKVHPFEADFRYGALLLVAREGSSFSGPAIELIHQVAADVTFACCLKGGKRPVYLLLRELKT